MRKHVGSWLLILIIACAALAQEPIRKVDIQATDGTRLKGTYFPAGRSGPGILLFHQSNRDRQSWEVLAEQLAAAGINVLTLDSRGHGETAGNSKEAEKWWPEDLAPAFNYLISQPGVNRDVIGAGGAGVLGVQSAVELA